jgi:hypothetical protein
MRKFYGFCLVITILSFGNCKKDTSDPITSQDVSGMVFNQCNDSGLSGIPLTLFIYKNNAPFTNYKTSSVAGGTFTFTTVDIHSASQYSYNIFVQSSSGVGATNQSNAGFEGTTLPFTYDQASGSFQVKVIPHSISLSVVHTYTGAVNNLNDSIHTLFTQNLLHLNSPLSTFSYTGVSYGVTGNSTYTISNYPMGMWNIKIDKWRSGVHTTLFDSLYIPWAGIKTYSVNW